MIFLSRRRSKQACSLQLSILNKQHDDTSTHALHTHTRGSVRRCSCLAAKRICSLCTTTKSPALLLYYLHYYYITSTTALCRFVLLAAPALRRLPGIGWSRCGMLLQHTYSLGLVSLLLSDELRVRMGRVMSNSSRSRSRVVPVWALTKSCDQLHPLSSKSYFGRCPARQCARASPVSSLHQRPVQRR